jgi:hypothetical protein
MQIRLSDISALLFRTTLLSAIILTLLSCEPFTKTAAPAATEAATVSTAESIVPKIDATLIPPTAIRTPPALPAIYQSRYLNPLDTPHTYMQDTCQYLRNKWNINNSAPGTVVMIIMLQNIYKGTLVEEPGGITAGQLAIMMNELHAQGFEAINTEQMLAFMERNQHIPPRSVMIIQDNRRQYEHFERHFGGYWKDWGWPIVNGWQSQPDTSETLWEENIALEREGFVDHQAQGVMIGTFITEDTSKAILTRELQGSLDAFAERYAKTPIAFIWPGGGFGQRPVLAARQLGYQLGFTSNSRGPVMYNWVPLADELDPKRPAFIPEGRIGDPLMTLPRYWPSQVLDAIDSVRIMGNEAAAYALENKETELEYYSIMCEGTYGRIPLD